MKIGVLFFYPFKSLQGIETLSLELTPIGPKYDRIFVLTDLNGNFLSQRKLPQMAQIKTSIVPDFCGGPAVAINLCDLPTHHVPILEEGELLGTAGLEAGYSPCMIKIHDDTCPGIDMGDVHAEWFSAILRQQCRVVRQIPYTPRLRDSTAVKGKISVSYADGYPLLAISWTSVDDLNRRLEAKNALAVSPARFRPNIIFSDCDAFAEDQLGLVRIGDTVVCGVRKCSRCVIVNTDQKTGARDKGSVTLATLAEYRKEGNGVYFGMNCLVDQAGTISVDDLVTPIV